jgi:hypothetical protein
MSCQRIFSNLAVRNSTEVYPKRTVAHRCYIRRLVKREATDTMWIATAVLSPKEISDARRSIMNVSAVAH